MLQSKSEHQHMSESLRVNRGEKDTSSRPGGLRKIPGYKVRGRGWIMGQKGLCLTRHTRVHSTEILKSRATAEGATKFHLISTFYLGDARQKVEQEQFKQQS